MPLRPITNEQEAKRWRDAWRVLGERAADIAGGALLTGYGAEFERIARRAADNPSHDGSSAVQACCAAIEAHRLAGGDEKARRVARTFDTMVAEVLFSALGEVTR